MKTTLLLLLCLVPTIAFGDVYRFYVVHAKAGAVDRTQVEPAQLIAQADGDAVSIYAYAEVSTRMNGGHYVCINDVEIAERLNSQGEVTSKIKKKIGTEFQITEGKEDAVTYSFFDARLMRWQAFPTPQGSLLQPILKTVKTMNRVVVRTDSFVLAGALDEGATTIFYLLQRKSQANQALVPTPMSVTPRARHASRRPQAWLTCNVRQNTSI